MLVHCHLCYSHSISYTHVPDSCVVLLRILIVHVYARISGFFFKIITL